MPHYTKLTPNLVVGSVERSLAFYVDTLGFTRAATVPDAPPFVFASVTSGAVEIFFNDAVAATSEYPIFADKPIGATATMFIEMHGVDALHDRLEGSVKIVMPLVTQFYGLREFAIEDPDGYVITFAERVNG
jgi:lactoylglutathione lyase